MKTINKFLAVILSLALFISVCPLGVFTFTASAATYSGSCGTNVSWNYNTSTYTLTISGTGAMTDYSSSYYGGNYVTTAPWRSYCSAMKTLVIGSGVTSIGDYSFSGCSGLTSVTIPDSVKIIGMAAFEQCDSLQEIAIPEGVTVLTEAAFYGCDNLSCIYIPEALKTVEENVFHGCNNLDLISYGGTKKTKSKLTVADADSYNSVFLNAEWHFNCDWFYYNLLDNNGNMTIYGIRNKYYSGELNIPATIKGYPVTALDFGFFDCKGITSVNIPHSVVKINNGVFSSCTGIESITTDSANTVYHAKDNCLIETKTKTLIAGCKTSVIPSDGSVTSIAQSAFYGLDNLYGIDIPNTVKSIGVIAFAYCDNLNYIKIPASLTTVEECAFEGSPRIIFIVDEGSKYFSSNGNCLTNIKTKTLIAGCNENTIPKDGSVRRIADSAFGGYRGLTEITIPDSVIEIGEFAFSNCNNLKSIVIPQSVKQIGWSAFYGCSSLTDVYYSGCTLDKSNMYISTLRGDNDCLLNAKWHYARYSIIYNLNGGKNNSGNPKTFTSTTATITLKNPTKSGYTFKGWYSDSGYKTKVTKIAKGTAKNITLYAKWEKAYTVTYKLNSGTNNSANPKTFTATTATITLKNPTRKGYIFKGWYSDAKFKTKVTKITKGTKKNITLYVKWAINTYKITYKLNSGKNNAKNPKSYKVTTATITLKNPTRKGYTFKGWYSDSKYKTKVTKIAKGSTGNKTLYAKWAKKK